MKIEIEIPDTLAIALREGPTITVDLTKMDASIIARGAVMGLGQKARNFAASALMNCKVRAAGKKRTDETDAAYDKRVEAMRIDTEALQAEQEACIVAGLARLYAGDWGVERGASAPGIDKALIDFVIGKLEKEFNAQLPGFQKAKIADRRTMVDAWLDAKEGRRAKYAAAKADADAEAKKAAMVSLDDL
jgi:hypothetical protein